MIMHNKRWQLQEAKSQFSQLVDKAMTEEPQFVTRHGHDAVVILSFDDYKKLTQPKTDLVSFFRASPLLGEPIDISRGTDFPRDIEL